jgi:hypothetical protein
MAVLHPGGPMVDRAIAHCHPAQFHRQAVVQLPSDGLVHAVVPELLPGPQLVRCSFRQLSSWASGGGCCHHQRDGSRDGIDSFEVSRSESGSCSASCSNDRSSHCCGNRVVRALSARASARHDFWLRNCSQRDCVALRPLQGFDRRLESAAAICGANPWSTFRQITLPLVAPGVISGALFAFVTSFDEVVLALFIQSPYLQTLPVKMYASVTRDTDPTIAAASTLILAFTTLATAATTVYIARRNSVR